MNNSCSVPLFSPNKSFVLQSIFTLTKMKANCVSYSEAECLFLTQSRKA